MPPAENLSKPSVVRRIPTVKGQTSVWRDCCPCRRGRRTGRCPGALGTRIGHGPDGGRTRSRNGVRRARSAARRRTGTAREGRRPCLVPASWAEPRTCSWCVAVRPAVRSRPAVSEGFPWVLRGSARCTGLSGLGDTAASFPAGGGPVREVNDTSRTVRRRPRRRSSAAAAGFREMFGSDRGMKWGERGLLMRRVPRCKVPTRSKNGRMSSVARGWAARFADISSTAGGLPVDDPRTVRGGSGTA